MTAHLSLHKTPHPSQRPSRKNKNFTKRFFFGFNGKESDNSTAADSYDFGARILDARIGRWLGVDSYVSKFAMDSPYEFARCSPVIVVDIGGNYPIVITVRSFAPFDWFGASQWMGDGYYRGFSTSEAATSRLSLMAQFETDNQSWRVQSKGSTSVGRHLACPDGISDCPGEYTRDGYLTAYSESYHSSQSDGNHLETHLWGNDDAIIPGADGTAADNLQSPDINVHNSFNVSVEISDQGVQTLHITGKMSGDAFPAAEIFVEDRSGQKVFLAVSPAQYGPNDGPFTALFGDNSRDMANFDVQITTDAQGNFLGVSNGNETVSPQAWNRQMSSVSTANVPANNQFLDRKNSMPLSPAAPMTSKDFTPEGKVKN